MVNELLTAEDRAAALLNAVLESKDIILAPRRTRPVWVDTGPYGRSFNRDLPKNRGLI